MFCCKKCKIEKPYADFKKESRVKSGYDGTCILCRKKSSKEYYENNKDSILKKSKHKYDTNSQYREDKINKTEEYRLNNREKCRIACSKSYHKNKHKYTPNKKKIDAWKFNNKDKLIQWHKTHRATEKFKIQNSIKEGKRRASKLNATPSWVDHKKINMIYEKARWLESITGLKYHVDHVIPLKGKNVCGLHIWENLQLLEASINLSKGNKHESS